QAVVNGKKPHRKRIPIVGPDRAAAEEAEPITGNFDDAPTGAAQPGIDAENANRITSHGVVDSSAPGPRLEGNGAAHERRSPPASSPDREAAQPFGAVA